MQIGNWNLANLVNRKKASVLENANVRCNGNQFTNHFVGPESAMHYANDEQ